VHVLLTDVLTCPRCGPSFGLILLADAVAARRVSSGILGCANCRERYPVADGVVIADAGAAGGVQGEDAVAADAGADAGGETAQRLAALMGVSDGPAYLLLVGPAGRYARAITDMVEGVEAVVVNGPRVGEPSTGDGGVSHVRVGGSRLPLGSGRMAGVVVSGPDAAAWLQEAVRVLGPLGRLVLEPVPAGAEERLAELGLRVLARDADGMVAARVHR
jgi:uncharacterized protein YbaR (Trm112 family)